MAGPCQFKGAATKTRERAMAAVSEGDREAGSGPVSGSRIHRLQPGVRPDLAAPVSLPDVLRGIASPSDAAAARQLEGSLQRRAADQQLRDELAVYDFSGPKYQKFEEELARYGTSVLRAWAYSGYIFKLVSSRGFTLYPSETELRDLHRDPEVREELANMTVAVALPRSGSVRSSTASGAMTVARACRRSSWGPACTCSRTSSVGDASSWRSGGARTAAIPPSACRKRTPSPTRRYWRQARSMCWTISATSILGAGNIVALTLDQYSQDEIVELLGERSIRAVEGVLYRWRTQQKDRMQGGDGRDRRS